VIGGDHPTIREEERAIADAADVDRDAVIVDAPDRPEMVESSSQVVVGGEVRRLDRQSPLVEALRTAGRNQWRLGVYAPDRLTDRVGRAAVDVLGLDVEGPLVADAPPRPEATLEAFGTGGEPP
jgi:HD superfamily phosphohydrolase